MYRSIGSLTPTKSQEFHLDMLVILRIADLLRGVNLALPEYLHRSLV